MVLLLLFPPLYRWIQPQYIGGLMLTGNYFFQTGCIICLPILFYPTF